jgi:hypothetical protein
MLLSRAREQATKKPRQNMHGQEEAGSAGDPASIWTEAAARHDTMDMRMMCERLPPGVQDGDHAGLGAEMSRVGADDVDRLRGRLEQDIVDERLDLESDRSDRRRHGEDDVEIRNRQELGATIGEPLRAREPLALRTMSIAAAIIRDANVSAVLASFGMSAERRRPARFDSGHRTALVDRQPIALRGAESVAMEAENVRYLDPRAHARRSFERDDPT